MIKTSTPSKRKSSNTDGESSKGRLRSLSRSKSVSSIDGLDLDDDEIRESSISHSSNPRKYKRGNGYLTRGEFMKYCILLVVLSLVPFSLFNSQAFKALTEVHVARHKIHIHRKNIGKLVAAAATQIRRHITSEIQNKLISIKLDIATRHVMVILSAPATQVSVERAFSALALVLNPLRTSLKGAAINDILLCALNDDVLSLLDFEMFQL